MTGVSVINNQHAGFEIQYKLYVKLLSQGKLAIKVSLFSIIWILTDVADFLEVTYFKRQLNNIIIFILQPENVELVETEEELDPREGDIEKGKQIQLIAEMKKALESPILVTLKQGVPSSIQVEKDLPVALMNVKRAQVSQVIVDTVGAKIVIEGNIHRRTNSVRQADKNDDSGFFFETLEKTVHGECETYYTVSQTGPYQSVFQHEAQGE